MEVTPEIIESIGKAVAGVLTVLVTGVTGYFTWKTRYEVDRLYAKTYRPNSDGSPGPMRRHPKVMVKLFTRKPKDDEKTPD